MVQLPEQPVPRWEPYARPARDRIRVIETSCCGAYEWACQGGQFLILRRTESEQYEETARGVFRQARQAWQALLIRHEEEHRREGLRTGAGSKQDDRAGRRDGKPLSGVAM